MITLAEMEVQYKDILEGIFALLAEDWKVTEISYQVDGKRELT